MSVVEQRIRDLLVSFLSEEISLDELRDSQVGLQREAEANRDAKALDLADEIEVLFAEFSSDHRSEQSLRSELRKVSVHASSSSQESAAAG